MGVKGNILSVEERRHRSLAALLTSVVSIVLLILKFWAHNLTQSQAIFSDALESIVNVLVAFVALWVIWYSAKPADDDHPYGHGKVEYFSAAFEGGLISFAAIMIGMEAVRALLKGEGLHRLSEGLIILGVTAVINLLLGVFLISRGKKLSSAALRASGHHVISDSVTTVSIIIGLILVGWSGKYWLDPVLAFAVAAWLGWTGVKLVLNSIAALMDQQDPTVLEALAEVLERSRGPGIIQIHHARIIRSGWYHHIDAHVVMPEFWDVMQVHKAIKTFETKVISAYEFGGEMNFHVDPCRRAYCEACDLRDCHIRQEDFKKNLPVHLADLLSMKEPPEYLHKRNGQK